MDLIDFHYNGMVSNRTNLPHGFGRAISKNGRLCYEGQFEYGILHGFVRCIKKYPNLK